MRRIISTLYSAAFFLGSTSSLVEGRMGGNTGSDSSSSANGFHKDMASAVDFQTFDLDGQVHDLMWCGYNDEVVLMHTSEGTIYRSRDRGLSWKRLKGLLQKTAFGVADEDQEVSHVWQLA